MGKITAIHDGPRQSERILSATGHRRIRIIPLGMALGLFLSLTFVLCVLFDLWFPGWAMYQAWAPLLPGFTWISWGSFFIGLLESFAYGWYVVLLFVPIYNFFSRSRITTSQDT